MDPLQYCNELSMTIELDSTLAQAEVLFLSFAQLVADFDRRKNEDATKSEGLRSRNTLPEVIVQTRTATSTLLSDNLRNLLETEPA